MDFMGQHVYPQVPGVDCLPADFRTLLQTEPGVGFSIVDADGIVRFTNGRAAELFLQAKPEEVIGKSLSELFGPEWAKERMSVLKGVIENDKPAIIRHIRNGRQVQSTIHLISEPEDDETAFFVVTIAGEHDPNRPGAFEIVESKLAHLGPLDVLSRREMEVLALIGHGMSTPQIAAALHRSPNTIERHCEALRAKLKTTNRLQLAEFAHTAGLRLEDAGLERI
jgi:DNA-binding CsgD family transcriptional regulator